MEENEDGEQLQDKMEENEDEEQLQDKIEENEDGEQLQEKQEECDDEKYNSDAEESSRLNLKQLSIVEEQNRSVQVNSNNNISETRCLVIELMR
jgi:hypothetical protein